MLVYQEFKLRILEKPGTVSLLNVTAKSLANEHGIVCGRKTSSQEATAKIREPDA